MEGCTWGEAGSDCDLGASGGPSAKTVGTGAVGTVPKFWFMPWHDEGQRAAQEFLALVKDRAPLNGNALKD